MKNHPNNCPLHSTENYLFLSFSLLTSINVRLLYLRKANKCLYVNFSLFFLVLLSVGDSISLSFPLSRCRSVLYFRPLNLSFVQLNFEHKQIPIASLIHRLAYITFKQRNTNMYDDKKKFSLVLV